MKLKVFFLKIANAFVAQQKCMSRLYRNGFFCYYLSGIATASFSGKDIVESLTGGTASSI